MVWGMLRPDEVGLLFSGDPIEVLVQIGVIFIFTNVLTDYLSNCQTRYVLGRLVASQKTNAHQSAFYTNYKWLIADLVLTLSLSVGIVLLFSELAKTEILVLGSNCKNIDLPPKFISDYTPYEVDKLISLHVSKITTICLYKDSNFSMSVSAQHYTPPFGVFFYTTVLTSAWLWVYVISGSFLRMVSRVLGPNAIVFKMFDFNNHPLGSLGGVSALLVGSAFIVVSAIHLSCS